MAMTLPKVEITKHWSDTSHTIGYAEGKLSNREFTASWATNCSLGAIFYDTWLDSGDAQTRAIARALTKAGAIPVPHLA
jgi:hypothetical protein